MVKQALRLDVDGNVQFVELAPDASTALRGFIGCTWFERVRLGTANQITGNELDMWVDEEGAIGTTEDKLNPVAVALLAALGKAVNGYIFGNVVFVESNPEGDMVGLSDKTLENLQSILTGVRSDVQPWIDRRRARQASRN